MVVHEFNGGVFPASAIGAKISKKIVRQEKPTKVPGKANSAEAKGSTPSTSSASRITQVNRKKVRAEVWEAGGREPTPASEVCQMRTRRA